MSADNFSVSVMDVQDLTLVEEQHEYVKQLLAVSTLHFLQPARVCKAFKKKKEYGLCFLQDISGNNGTELDQCAC